MNNSNSSLNNPGFSSGFYTSFSSSSFSTSNIPSSSCFFI
jgi:hypothetical protein